MDTIFAQSPGFVQVLGWAAAVLVVASFQCRTRGSLIVVQAVAYVLFGVHLYLLGAWTGSAMCAIGVVRLATAFYMDSRPALRRAYLGFFPIIWIATWLTATGWESLLPAIGYTLGTYAVWQRNVLVMRVLYLSAHPFWLGYNVAVGSQGGVAMEVLNILSSASAIVRHHALPAWRRKRAE